MKKLDLKDAKEIGEDIGILKKKLICFCILLFAVINVSFAQQAKVVSVTLIDENLC